MGSGILDGCNHNACVVEVDHEDGFESLFGRKDEARDSSMQAQEERGSLEFFIILNKKEVETKKKFLLQDCVEYFTFMVLLLKGGQSQQERAFVVPVSFWYKFYVSGKHGVSLGYILKWDCTEEELKRVYVQFKLLKQVIAVDAYYDNFEMHKGKCQLKIPALPQIIFVGQIRWWLKGRNYEYG